MNRLPQRPFAPQVITCYRLGPLGRLRRAVAALIERITQRT